MKLVVPSSRRRRVNGPEPFDGEGLDDREKVGDEDVLADDDVDREYVGDGEVLADDDTHREEHDEAEGLEEREAVLHKVSDGEFDRVAV